MGYVKGFVEFINETLNSDKVDTAIKKLDAFFTKRGFTKKPAYGNAVADSPYYQVITDKEFAKNTLTGYMDKNRDPIVRQRYAKMGMDLDDTIKGLEKRLSEFNYDTIVINTDSNSRELSIELIALIASMGYHIVSVGTWGTNLQNDPQEYDPKVSLLSRNRIRLLVIQPNYGEKVEFRGDYLYHTTDVKYLDKILKYGLVPKSKNNRFFYPGRIYLTPSKEFNDVLKLELIRQKSNFNYEQEKIAWKSSVDLKIKNFRGLTLYRDMMLPAKASLDFPEGGFFTYDNIPPRYIEVLPHSGEDYPI